MGKIAATVNRSEKFVFKRKHNALRTALDMQSEYYIRQDVTPRRLVNIYLRIEETRWVHFQFLLEIRRQRSARLQNGNTHENIVHRQSSDARNHRCSVCLSNLTRGACYVSRKIC